MSRGGIFCDRSDRLIPPIPLIPMAIPVIMHFFDFSTFEDRLGGKIGDFSDFMIKIAILTTLLGVICTVTIFSQNII